MAIMLSLRLVPVFMIISSPVIVHVAALKIGIQSVNSVSQECSRKCESAYCTAPPFLRYGKYCGLLYTGCPGEKPCDYIDRCCMIHDACIDAKHNDYLSTYCNGNFLKCIASYKGSPDGKTFKGNECMVKEVVDVMTVVIEAALLAGKALDKP